MSNTDEQHETPPFDFGNDDDNTTNNKTDDSMFVSVLSPATVDVSLSGGEDDDEDNPFGEPIIRKKTPTNTTNTVESFVDNEKKLFEQDKSTVKVNEDDEDLWGDEKISNDVPSLSVPPLAPVVVSQPQTPITPIKQENNLFSEKTSNDVPPLSVPPLVPVVVSQPQTPTTPIKQENKLFSVDENINTPPPVRSTPPFESQFSSSTPISKSVLSETVTARAPVQKVSHENNIEITVSAPTKVGEGMSSYMVYRITTKTTLPIFKKSECSVSRRFSDFLGLHMKLVHKYLHTGIIIPSPPEKDTISMAKVKISKDEPVPTDFIDRRRALLERYLNRLVHHNKLIEDSDVRDFLEMPNDLPKSTNTQALSSAGVLRALTNIGNQVTKLTTKTSEQDQWFEEKHTFILDLHTHLKHLYNQFNTLFSQRKESTHALKQFSLTLNHLATIEEHTLLSSALMELANLKEKLDQINNEQCLKEYSTLTELIKEYVFLLDMVELAFNERIKTHQTWLNAEETLKKKRETKTKLEQTPKGADKIPHAEMEIQEWEGKVVRGKEEFERISTTIKQEMELFEQTRVDDFKKAINDYLNNYLEEQEKILQIWETYLPEANKINV